MRSLNGQGNNGVRIAVAGAGIAGISVAAAFSSAGFEVSIFDKAPMSQSSYQQHGWFHTGDLYRFADHDVPDIFTLNAERLSRLSMMIKRNESPWLGSDHIIYLVPPSGIKRNVDINHIELITETDPLSMIFGPGFRGIAETSFNFNSRTSKGYVSSDRTMITETILKDLISFGGLNSVIWNEEDVEQVEQVSGEKVRVNGKTFDHLFVCAPSLYALANCELGCDSRYSMIAVSSSEQIVERSFAIVTTNSENSLNCMRHTVGEHNYLAWGDGVNHNVYPSDADQRNFLQKLKRLGIKIDDFYIGKKVSLRKECIYAPSILNDGGAITVIDIGKFSFFPTIFFECQEIAKSLQLGKIDLCLDSKFSKSLKGWRPKHARIASANQSI